MLSTHIEDTDVTSRLCRILTFSPPYSEYSNKWNIRVAYKDSLSIQGQSKTPELLTPAESTVLDSYLTVRATTSNMVLPSVPYGVARNENDGYPSFPAGSPYPIPITTPVSGINAISTRYDAYTQRCLAKNAQLVLPMAKNPGSSPEKPVVCVVQLVR